MTTKHQFDEGDHAPSATLLQKTLDSNPEETLEWLEAVAGVLDNTGSQRCEQLLLRVLQHARQRGVNLRGSFNTP